MKRETKTTGEVGVDFLRDSGDIGEMLRAKDWSDNPLGPPQNWPQSLKTSVSILLNSRHPMFVLWGRELINIYNDAYRPITGDKHPWALGQPGPKVWPEIWDTIGPMVERVVRHGEATWSDDVLLFMQCRGYLEEVYFTFSYSPVRDETGGVGGMFCACMETTAKVLSERRLRALRDLAAAPVQERTQSDACTLLAQVLSLNPADVPFALIYLLDAEQGSARLVASAGIDRDASASATVVDPSTWPLLPVAAAGHAEYIEGLQPLLSEVPRGPWPEAPSSAVVMPLMDRAQQRAAGVLVLGISSRRRFDDDYRGFFELVAGQIATSIAKARASEAEKNEYRAFSAPDGGAAVYFRDISTRKSALQALRSSEERFRQLADSMPQIVWTSAADGNITFINRQWQLYVGLTLEQTQDKQMLAQVLHPDDVPAVLTRWQRSLATGEPHEVQWRFKRQQDGAWRWFLTRAIPVRADDGTIREWFGTATDIHEQKLAEERLRESEQRFARFMRHVPGLAWVKELDGRFEYVNEAAAQAWGVRREMLPGKTVAQFFPPDIARQSEESDRLALEHESGIQALETFIDATGAKRHALTSKFPIPDADGKTTRIGGIAIDVTERNVIQERLRESEERFAKAFNASPLVLTISSLETGKLIEVNDTFVRVSGYSREEAIGHTTAELGLWAKREDREQEMDEVRRSGTVREVEYRFCMRNGKEMIGMLSADRIEIGGEACTLTVIQDITERKRIELASRESEERLRLAVAGAGMGTWDTDLATGTIYWNPQHFEILGYPRDTVSATTDMWRSRLHPEDMPAVIAARDEARRTRGFYVVEARIVRADNGEIRWLSAFGRFLYGADGDAKRFIGVCFDITERKRTEAALRESMRLYRAIGESIDYGVWVCDPQGRNIYASESFLRLVGLTQEECSAFGWGEVLHPDDTERTITAWKECARAGGQWDMEHRFRGVDGKWHPVLARGVPVRNEHGEITAWAGINLDISRLKQVETELREAHHRKDEFLATLAHELRNPLAPIRNGLEIMRLARDNSDVTESARGMMERQLQQMVRLVDDLLDMSRISRGKVELRKEPVELAAILQAAVETSRPLIEEAAHKLTIDVPPEPIYLDADMTRLAQVFANLLNNAAKYTDPGGHISLTASACENEAVIRVKDNGIGIPAQMLLHVFDMFTQLDHPLEKSHDGLGIGLSLVKRLVEMHGGTVAAHSDGHGMGSEFVVRLPMCAAMRVLAPSLPAEEASALASRRILIADDHADAAASLATMLKIMGNEVRTACDGAEAAEVAALFRPELVLLDIGMPNMNGYEACRRIRTQPGGAGMTIVALTGWGQHDDKRRSQEAGFDDHLVKPIEPAVIEKLLAVFQAR